MDGRMRWRVEKGVRGPAAYEILWPVGLWFGWRHVGLFSAMVLTMSTLGQLPT
jgi:hypothetical protein